MTATRSPRAAPAQAATATQTITEAAPARRAAPVKRAATATTKRRVTPAKVTPAKAVPAKAAAPAEVATPVTQTPPAVVTPAVKSASTAPAPKSRLENKTAAVKAPAARKAANVDDGKKAITRKIVRDTFSMPDNEQAQLKALRSELKKAGRRTSKSEVLRAGLRLLLEQDAATRMARINALPPAAAKKKRK